MDHNGGSLPCVGPFQGAEFRGVFGDYEQFILVEVEPLKSWFDFIQVILDREVHISIVPLIRV
jgi:hypothetical protein